jgi:hypothetical protein
MVALLLSLAFWGVLIALARIVLPHLSNPLEGN